ncbi:hypothetical protein C8J57DRAFT_1724739 [Mycena rebaudengoi]|nr:hypothetical protein C8J57DRAFT_1724739 [Mycena rebaudengoi]
MQFIASLTIALFTLALSASASPVALTPDSVAAAGLTNVHDFQGNSLNLVEASQVDGTPVILFPTGFDGSINQQWSFIANGSNFVIANGLNPSLALSYPGAPFGATPDFASPVVYSNLPTVFSLLPLPPPSPGFRIQESISKTVLTSWQVVPGILQTPVSLAPISTFLQNQQTWTIVAAPALTA